MIGNLRFLHFELQDDVTKHVYYENEDPDMWQGDLYNWYFAEVYISTEMKYGKEIFFYFERVKEGVSIIFDNSHMNRDCTGRFEFDSMLETFYNNEKILHSSLSQSYFSFQIELIPNGFSHVSLLTKICLK